LHILRHRVERQVERRVDDEVNSSQYIV
jgi:hypothetical protein